MADDRILFLMNEYNHATKELDKLHLKMAVDYLTGEDYNRYITLREYRLRISKKLKAKGLEVE